MKLQVSEKHIKLRIAIVAVAFVVAVAAFTIGVVSIGKKTPGYQTIEAKVDADTCHRKPSVPSVLIIRGFIELSNGFWYSFIIYMRILMLFRAACGNHRKGIEKNETGYRYWLTFSGYLDKSR